MNTNTKIFKLNPTYKIETHLNEATHPWNRVTMPRTTLLGLILMIISLAGYFWIAKVAQLTDWQFDAFSLADLEKVPPEYWRVVVSDVLTFSGVLLTLWSELQRSNRRKVEMHADKAISVINEVRYSPEEYVGCDDQDLRAYQSSEQRIRACLGADERFSGNAIRLGILLIVIGLGFRPFIV